ncbi:LiaF domain-containing protein [Dysgonomonas sp. 511]|uniref:LiaF transmembrane domain-containing protein n=1 Tax=Dysgonomonas sp. 511 TaxID=2302930 RepID=UPI0013D3CB08|nr:LiaF domain-containing protein [Dysgonomonas sp. 511]
METTNPDKNYLFKRGGGNGTAFALLLILMGGLFLLLNLNIIPAIYKPILISWQMVLIVIGMWTLLVKKNILGGIAMLAIGVAFIYPKLSQAFPQLTPFNIDMHTYWPVLLILFGILLVFRGRFKPRHSKWNKAEYETNGNAKANEADIIDKNLMFGSSEQIVLSENFCGGECNVMFGEIIVDLRRAKMAEGIHQLEINAMFASGVIYVPADWKIEVRSSAILGSVDDKRYQSAVVSDDASSQLIVKASCMFGSCEIRN